MSRLFLFFVFCLPMKLWAGVFDMNVVYGSDTLKTADEVTSNMMSYDFAVGIPIGKRDIYVAVNYASVNSSYKTDTEVKYAGTDMGLKFGAFLGRGRWFSSSLTYNLKSTVKVSGTEEAELRGTSIKFDMGLNHWFSETAALTFKFYYYMPTLPEKLIEESMTSVSYSRASMGQSVGLSWLF